LSGGVDSVTLLAALSAARRLRPSSLVRCLAVSQRQQSRQTTPCPTPRWRSAFAAAFPEANGRFNFDQVIKAIATFERTLISGHSPFDEYVFNGKHDALTVEAKRGMALFYSERLGCGSCHSGFNFSGAWRDAQGATAEPSFANNGVGTTPMRVPTLRNVALTAPYMHDGSLSTLEAVLDHYQHAGPPLRAFTLTKAEQHELIAFLQSLTDPTFTAEFDGERTHPVSR
jgi:cytochrome c peroxidase